MSGLNSNRRKLFFCPSDEFSDYVFFKVNSGANVTDVRLGALSFCLNQHPVAKIFGIFMIVCHVYQVKVIPTHRKARHPRRARKRLPPKFHRDVSILFRPDDVAHRRQFGHWEANLILFKQKLGQSNVTSLVERVSRYTVLLKNPSKRTKPVMGKIIKAIKDLPHAARKSITFDRGTGFVSWPHLQAEIGTRRGFVTHHLSGRKVRLRTPTVVQGVGFPASATSGCSQTRICK